MKLTPFGNFLVGLAMCAALVSVGCQHVVMEDVKKDNASNNASDSKPSEATKQVSMIDKSTKPSYNKLTKDEERVIIHKGTERAWTGEYTDLKAKGTFICRRCNAPLYKSDAKFDSHCGWPSFDDEMKDSVERLPDPDGHRVEIVCKNCGGHLGHVFEGEGFTTKNTRHCVNSISVKFIADGQALPEVIHLDKLGVTEEKSSPKPN